MHLRRMEGLLNEGRDHEQELRDRGVFSEPVAVTKYLYMWNFFAALCNIDYEMADDTNLLKYLQTDEYGRMLGFFSEEKKIDLLVDYLWTPPMDDDTQRQLVDAFFGTMDRASLKAMLDDIPLDDDDPLCEFYGISGLKAKTDFTATTMAVYDSRAITDDQLKDILHFIYRVQCNMFHNITTFDNLTETSKGRRLNFYADILEAVARLVFNKVLRPKKS